MQHVRLVVLTNSWKHKDWCLAGIDLETGKWIRPVSELSDGRVTQNMMKLGGRFPEILDVIDIPLHPTGPDFDFECENRTLAEGDWRFVRRASVDEVIKYAERPRYILHNHMKFCTLEEMQSRSPEDRRTLQLVQVDNFAVADLGSEEEHDWKATIYTGGMSRQVKITDPVFCGKLCDGHTPSPRCLLAMSMTLPFPIEGWEGSPPCWKIVAGVIEL